MYKLLLFLLFLFIYYIQTLKALQITLYFSKKPFGVKSYQLLLNQISYCSYTFSFQLLLVDNFNLKTAV
uniref:Uncharacterized protein n=1 Tax=Bartonella rochalimae ATCC BAA-1498 TaxID=685782 RepID=E6YKM3_9HYPH|nr:hypothetical protein BARRO_20068 [Bartonella rochalimae ATCC BAA-1498]